MHPQSHIQRGAIALQWMAITGACIPLSWATDGEGDRVGDLGSTGR
ncbi:hypothetical protein [Leptothermofonsia sp. ETS-13]